MKKKSASEVQAMLKRIDANVEDKKKKKRVAKMIDRAEKNIRNKRKEKKQKAKPKKNERIAKLTNPTRTKKQNNEDKAIYKKTLSAMKKEYQALKKKGLAKLGVATRMPRDRTALHKALKTMRNKLK